jgi:hypothetical protein
LLVAVGQAVEAVAGVWVVVERVGEVGRHGDFAGLRVGFDVHVDLVAGSDTCGVAVACAERDEESAVHGSDGAAVGVAVDGDADLWPLSRPETRDDLGWDGDAGGGLAVEADRGTESHGWRPFSLARRCGDLSW